MLNFEICSIVLEASLEVRAAGRRAVNTIAGNMGEKLVILHYNDVYNVEARPSPEPVGGAARFCTAIKSFQHLNPLVLFSGDAFSPSMLSTFTKGEQMVPVLNEIGTHCAVLGNHDFDHGLQVLSQWVPKCKFPWLMSNVLDNETGRPLGEGRITHVVHWAGHRIGLIGLVEKEWLETLATINPDETTFFDFCEAGQKLGNQLREEGCDYIIALTHMRTPNDIKLAENCDQIDLILGGHDHVFEVLHVNGKYIIKSGTDFRNFSKISVNFEKTSSGRPEVAIEEVQVTSAFPEDPVLKEIVEKYTSVIESKMNDVLGCFSVPLDGEDLLAALENGVSMYPKLEGRFPQVAGISFAFDPSKPPGQRVDLALVRIGDEYLQLKQDYKLATKSYLHNGRDGFTMFENAEVLVDEGECPELGMAIQNHFQAINMRLGKTKKHSKHRQSLVTLSRRHSLVKLSDGNELDGPPPLRRSSRVPVNTNIVPISKLTRRQSLDDLEQESCQLIPKIDQRIIIINSEEKRKELIDLRERILDNNAIIEMAEEYSVQN